MAAILAITRWFSAKADGQIEMLMSRFLELASLPRCPDGPLGNSGYPRYDVSEKALRQREEEWEAWEKEVDRALSANEVLIKY